MKYEGSVVEKLDLILVTRCRLEFFEEVADLSELRWGWMMMS